MRATGHSGIVTLGDGQGLPRKGNCTFRPGLFVTTIDLTKN